MSLNKVVSVSANAVGREQVLIETTIQYTNNCLCRVL